MQKTTNMAKLVKSEKISLKNHPEINENSIQEFIFNDPSVLGLGNLIPISREKTQPMGGRLDILLSDQDGVERYEVEIQLGSTDPSHIIRTIEYWDTEKKRYPQYNHCAVIVAEEITGRFMNVISLFNGAIPLIALQMSAIKHGNDIELIFTKVLDRISLANDTDFETAEVTDRKYWEEKQSSSIIIKTVDNIFDDIKELIGEFELKFNKFYIGISKNGITKNFICFRPRKNFVYLCIKLPEDDEITRALDNAGLEVAYNPRDKEYRIHFEKHETFKKHKELLLSLVENAKRNYCGED